MNTATTMSESLFKSIYADLYKLAAEQQAAIWNGLSKKKKKDYYIGECQIKLNEFCCDKLTAVEALEFIKLQLAYKTPIRKAA